MILLINPNTSGATAAMMAEAARAHLPPGLALHTATAARGARMILSAADLPVARAETLRLATTPRPGTTLSAIVVAAFADPSVATLRRLLATPVIGIAEAAMAEAARHGPFGIATTTPGLANSILGHVARLGHAPRFTGLQLTRGDPLALAADPAAQDAALEAAALRCIAEGAASVIIGGGPLSATAARLRARLAIPIVEPLPAAARAAIAPSPPRGAGW